MDTGETREQGCLTLTRPEVVRRLRRAPVLSAVSRRGVPRPRTVPVVGITLLVVGLMACSGPTADARCSALASLRSAVRSVASAEAAERAGDVAEVRRLITDVARLVARAQSGLANGAVATTTHARRLLEAANYLEFIVQEFESSGAVDGTLAQFASRELNRTLPGEAPLPC